MPNEETNMSRKKVAPEEFGAVGDEPARFVHPDGSEVSATALAAALAAPKPKHYTAAALYRRQAKNRGGPLEFADPFDLVWSETYREKIPAELAALPDDHYEPFFGPLYNPETGALEPRGNFQGWRLTAKGRAACEAAGGKPDTSPKKRAKG